MTRSSRIELDPEVPFEAERREMLEVQIRRRGIRDSRVLEAMCEVPRHKFVPPSLADHAYEDRPLPIGDHETISQPYIVAAMTQAAQVRPGEKILEVGTGSGYQAAVLAYLGARVYSVERNPALAETARVRLAELNYREITLICGDGSEGYPSQAPYDAILITAAAPKVPPILTQQLADGGRLVIPVGDLAQQDLLLIFKHGSEQHTRTLDPCQFVPLIGKYGWPEKTIRTH